MAISEAPLLPAAAYDKSVPNEVVPGIVTAKPEIMQHFDVGEDFNVTHIVSFQNFLSPESLDRLLLGEASFHGRVFWPPQIRHLPFFLFDATFLYMMKFIFEFLVALALIGADPLFVLACLL